MKNFRNVLLLSLAWVAIRYFISFNVPATELTDYTRILVMFGPIAPLLAAVYGYIKENGYNFDFLNIFKATAKAGFMYSVIYLLGLLVLFHFVNPSDFSARKALLLAQQIQANTAAGISSPEETREKLNGIFTSFNYVTATFMVSVIVTLVYSVFISILGMVFKNRRTKLYQE